MDSRVHSIVTLVGDPRLSSAAMSLESIQWVVCIQRTTLPVYNLGMARQSGLTLNPGLNLVVKNATPSRLLRLRRKR